MGQHIRLGQVLRVIRRFRVEEGCRDRVRLPVSPIPSICPKSSANYYLYICPVTDSPKSLDCPGNSPNEVAREKLSFVEPKIKEMQTVTRQIPIRYFLFTQSVKGQTFEAIFYRISAWLDHWFSSGFAGIVIFTYIQVCGVPAKLINF